MSGGTSSERVIITGAAGGIGAALSAHFLSLGHEVTGVDIDAFPPALSQCDGFTAHCADVTDEPAMEAVFDAAAATGPIRTVIANAAVTDLDHADTLSLPYATWARVLEINVTGSFVTARTGARRMAASGGGNIVFVTSSLARLSDAKANDAPYCTSKAAVEMLARVMALELASTGINVNTLFPSAMIDTGFFARWDAAARAKLAAPGILNETAAFLAALAPGAATGRALDQARWVKDTAYRASWGASK